MLDKKSIIKRFFVKSVLLFDLTKIIGSVGPMEQKIKLFSPYTLVK